MKRYNAEGSDGLVPLPMSGRRPRLKAVQHEDLRGVLRQAPLFALLIDTSISPFRR